MKALVIVLLCFNLIDCFAQTINTDKYYSIYSPESKDKHFVMANHSYIDSFKPDAKIFDGKKFYPRIRKYSWGSIDTAYYREDSENYYHFDTKINKESIVLPKKLTLNQIWYESDSSWSYQLIKIKDVLKTPAKKYKDLIVVECKQLKNRDTNKSSVYHIFYAKNYGMVASVSSNKIISYLID
jgi:hypothetical protein